MSQNPIRISRLVSLSLKREVLAEAGYRCAVPICRSILVIDMHHLLEVRAGGPHTLSNRLALCPTCHALSTRGTISREAIHAWKTMLVSLNHAFGKILFILYCLCILHRYIHCCPQVMGLCRSLLLSLLILLGIIWSPRTLLSEVYRATDGERIASPRSLVFGRSRSRQTGFEPFRLEGLLEVRREAIETHQEPLPRKAGEVPDGIWLCSPTNRHAVWKTKLLNGVPTWQSRDPKRVR